MDCFSIKNLSLSVRSYMHTHKLRSKTSFETIQINIFILIVHFSDPEYTDKVNKNDYSNNLTTRNSLIHVFQMVSLMITVASMF